MICLIYYKILPHLCLLHFFSVHMCVIIKVYLPHKILTHLFFTTFFFVRDHVAILTNILKILRRSLWTLYFLTYTCFFNKIIWHYLTLLILVLLDAVDNWSLYWNTIRIIFIKVLQVIFCTFRVSATFWSVAMGLFSWHCIAAFANNSQ